VFAQRITELEERAASPSADQGAGSSSKSGAAAAEVRKLKKELSESRSKASALEADVDRLEQTRLAVKSLQRSMDDSSERSARLEDELVETKEALREE